MTNCDATHTGEGLWKYSSQVGVEAGIRGEWACIRGGDATFGSCSALTSGVAQVTCRCDRSLMDRTSGEGGLRFPVSTSASVVNEQFDKLLLRWIREGVLGLLNAGVAEAHTLSLTRCKVVTSQ